MPATPLNFFDDEELLPLDNVLEFLKIAIDEGVKKIRITGGGVALSRVNVSLDSLKRVLKISQKDALKNTLEGVEESLKVGLKLKLNTVVIKSVNDDEILELLEYAKIGISKSATLNLWKTRMPKVWLKA